MKLNKNERIDDLQYKNLKIIQNTEGFCFGIDSVLLSDFAKKIKNNSKVVDIGTGTGIISILLTAKTNLEKVYAVEVQEQMSNLAKRNVKLNMMEDKIEVISDNIKDINNYISNNSIDVIVTNPPYKKNRSGIENENILKQISRHEIECNLDDIIRISSKLLKNKGEFYMIHTSERLAEIIFKLKEYKLEPKTIRMIYSHYSKNSKLFLVKAVKGAKENIKVEKPLIIYDDKGNYTSEIIKIYNKKEEK